MARITFNLAYNFWDILVHVGIQPSENDKYEYSEQDDTATLVVYDITQKQLDDGLNAYDHETFLASLPKPQRNEMDILRDYVLDMELRMILKDMGV